MVLAGSLVAGADVRAQEEGNRVFPELQEDLNRIIKEEVLVQREVREGMLRATQPYADYLLHQNSLQLVENTDRLRKIKQEKMELVQRLARMDDRIDLGVGLFPREEASKKVAISSTYSGAPSLSFNHAIRIDSEDLPRVSPSWIGFLRFIFFGYLILIFGLPLIAIQKRKASLSRKRGKRTLRVFPILTIHRRGGGCELLSLPLKAVRY
jgi:hypothetical protein